MRLEYLATKPKTCSEDIIEPANKAKMWTYIIEKCNVIKLKP